MKRQRRQGQANRGRSYISQSMARAVRHGSVTGRKEQVTTPKGNRASRGKSIKRQKEHRQSRVSERRLPARLEETRVRGLNALNRVRRGKSKSLTAAARAEGTTVKTIRRLLPAALMRTPSGRIRVKAGDSYSTKVEILTNQGPVVVIAHGSRERELAGRHRADVMRVLQGKAPKSTLRRYRGTTVGGYKLISDFDLLSRLAEAGTLEQLDSLYASPGASV